MKTKGDLYSVLYFPQNKRGRYFPKQKKSERYTTWSTFEGKKNPERVAWMSKFWIVFSLRNSGFGFFVGVVEKDVKELICGNPLFTYSLATLLRVRFSDSFSIVNQSTMKRGGGTYV